MSKMNHSAVTFCLLQVDDMRPVTLNNCLRVEKNTAENKLGESNENLLTVSSLPSSRREADDNPEQTMS